MLPCLCELDSIILELNRIASLRRFRRNRIFDICDTLDYVAGWVTWAHKEHKVLPKLHLQMTLEQAQKDLNSVIHYKKFMRSEMEDVWNRIHTLKCLFCSEDLWHW